MNAIRRFVMFWYHFVVGDDWRIAIGVVFGLGATAALVHDSQIQAWWLLPILVITMLTMSLWLATRRLR